MAYRQRMILGYESLLIQGLPRSLLHDMMEKFSPSNKLLQYIVGHAYNTGVLTHVLNVLFHVADCRQLQFVGAQSHTVYPPLAHHRGDAPRRRPYCCSFLVLGLPKQESAFGGVAEEGGCWRGCGNPDCGNTCLVLSLLKRLRDAVVFW